MVVAVILVLVGISLKIMSLVNRKAAISRTTWILEQVKNSLGAYYASYGMYPPGDKKANGYSSIEYVYVAKSPGNYPGCSNWFTSTGLVFYLTRVAEAPKWKHYIENPTVVPNKVWPKEIFNATYSIGGKTGPVPMYTNEVESIFDAWDTNLQYICTEADGYQSYKLWSLGPNGSNEFGGGDDLGMAPGE